MNIRTESFEKVEAPIKFDRPENLPSQYVESMSQMVMGFPNTRLVFNRYIEKAPGQPDIHHQSLELVIPTAALIENCLFILEQVMRNRAGLDTHRERWNEAVDGLMSRLEGNPPTSSNT